MAPTHDQTSPLVPDISFSALFQAHEELLALVGGLSIITFFSSLLIVPWLIVRIPHDYFDLEERRITVWTHRHPVLRWTGLLAKNLLGVVLVLLGVAMLVLPGQGLLTILIGMVLLNFPGKYRLERRLVQIGPVWRSVNWLRRRAGRRELVISERDTEGEG